MSKKPSIFSFQAVTKAVTLGALSFLLGVGLLYPQWWSKLLRIAGRRMPCSSLLMRLLDRRSPVRAANAASESFWDFRAGLSPN